MKTKPRQTWKSIGMAASLVLLSLLTACGSQNDANMPIAGVNTSLLATNSIANTSPETASTPLLDSLAKLYPSGQLPADRAATSAQDLLQNPAALKRTAEIIAPAASSDSQKDTQVAPAAVAADYAPVQRIQNTTLYGAYFFSIYPGEVSNALALNPHWKLEGPAFWTSRATGTDLHPVHRFQNKLNGSYLYTIYDPERADIVANYSATFAYEGVAWYARQTPATGWSTLWRFRNLSNGTYLFSAFESEKDAIVRDYPQVFKLEGPAYYVRQDAQADVDTTPPVITLAGANPLNLVTGQPYAEPGATCIDNKDATCSVLISGTVNTNTVGSYTLTYSATDAAGNSSSKTRMVNVVVACTAAPINLAEPYSLVFKACDANNVATYYEKTECVRQNSTNLIWQGQMPAGSGHLRANDQYKTNYDNISLAQQISIGINGLTFYHAPSIDTVNSPSNSIGFRNAVNASNLCGLNGWRLPTREEFLSIYSYGEIPRINNAWFPNASDRSYWTSTPDPVFAHNAEYFYFGETIISIMPPITLNMYEYDTRGRGIPVRLVR